MTQTQIDAAHATVRAARAGLDLLIETGRTERRAIDARDPASSDLSASHADALRDNLQTLRCIAIAACDACARLDDLAGVLGTLIPTEPLDPTEPTPEPTRIESKAIRDAIVLDEHYHGQATRAYVRARLVETTGATSREAAAAIEAAISDGRIACARDPSAQPLRWVGRD